MNSNETSMGVCIERFSVSISNSSVLAERYYNMTK